MVVFVCSGCGESLRKNKVDQHMSSCRSGVSCVDCGKEFGRDYSSHTQCVSEDQKYGGLDYQPKANTNIGQQKQEEWIQNELSETNAVAQELKDIKKQIYENLKREMDFIIEEKSSLAQMLSEEQNKRLQLESQLTESKRNEKSIEEYEKTINDLKTRLNIEEMSFMFERKTKERLSKENEQYSRKIQFLENEVKKLNELLTANRTPVATAAPVFSMPTTVNIHTTQPNNQTNLSISPMDISHSNPNSSSFSLNISRKLPTGTGSRLAMADEDGEFMDPNNLIALKRGECSLSDSHLDEERLSILQRRNTLVLPHLKTSYGVELPFMPNKAVDSETIKNGFPSNESMKALQRGFVSNDSLNPLKQIQNISYQRSEFTSRRNNSSISCDNVSINTINDKTFNKRVENIRYNSSKVSVKNLTPTKMFKRMMKGNAKTWTPNKK